MQVANAACIVGTQEDVSVNNTTFRFLLLTTTAFAFATSSLAPAQTFKTIDFPGATATTIAGGPNNQGDSVGQETNTAGVSHGFILSANGNFKVIDPPGSTWTLPNYIVDDGTVVGQYLDSNQVTHGFILSQGHYTKFDVPGALAAGLSGRNIYGEMTGFTCINEANCENTNYASFTVSRDGKITQFNPFDAPSSFASNVNARGVIPGTYFDSSGTAHGYVLAGGQFTENNFPGGTFTFNGGINAQGDIVGYYADTAGVFHSFLLRDGHYTSFDPPGAIFSDAAGINSSDEIVGFYIDSNDVSHGYIRWPCGKKMK
ncbi:MAG TPA: hypothetical protein VF753_18570 [Terriglobales bacterium]